MKLLFCYYALPIYIVNDYLQLIKKRGHEGAILDLIYEEKIHTYM